jgi:hypothetical protein
MIEFWELPTERQQEALLGQWIRAALNAISAETTIRGFKKC